MGAGTTGAIGAITMGGGVGIILPKPSANVGLGVVGATGAGVVGEFEGELEGLGDGNGVVGGLVGPSVGFAVGVPVGF
jgi:hypothetical protein